MAFVMKSEFSWVSSNSFLAFRSLPAEISFIELVILSVLETDLIRRLISCIDCFAIIQSPAV